MSDFLLDSSGDLDLSTNDLEISDGIDAIRQELQIRYRFFVGEWFLDRAEGVPYIENVLKKNANDAHVRMLLIDVAKSTPGVSEVRSYSASLDNSTRVLTVALEIGANIDNELIYEPFIVEVEL